MWRGTIGPEGEYPLGRETEWAAERFVSKACALDELQDDLGVVLLVDGRDGLGAFAVVNPELGLHLRVNTGAEGGCLGMEQVFEALGSAPKTLVGQPGLAQ